ncbi:glycosyltransferase family 2 protein [Ovoidimarina sediminis]|uniref:glycosyltransferase n=1 Tax=Ovoidimarina sediminis TaxID=3079856 RepID=UPI00290D6437|nr:glycosyltransferase family A protein [Rhodophyticola sp. MJ-SS7]MDU8942185.1 glycosyltransferase family A protein [Rhodophyticola sp. MJ-SS7]
MTKKPEPVSHEALDMRGAVVVVPAKDAISTLGACIAALHNAGMPRDRLIVVDDGSSDGTGDLARDAGVTVIRNETPLRPALARNKGVAASDAEIILFVDADVTVHPDALKRLLKAFDDPSTTAVIGSYDHTPPPSPALSKYRNLLHHHVHQTAPREAQTFWTGLGAVRRAAFDAAGGLDPDWTDIEDVEFGLRLIAEGGRIILDPKILGSHLKVWTMRSMVRTDFWGRAIPWTRLIAKGRIAPDALNTGLRHKLSALAVLTFSGALLGALIWPFTLWAALGAALGFVALNASFLALLWRVGGPILALKAIPYHAIHYATALGGYAYGRFSPAKPS